MSVVAMASPFPLSLIAVSFLLFLISTNNSQSCVPTEIQFSNDGLKLYLRFNSTVDTTGLIDNPSSCNNYFDQQSLLYLNESTCQFESGIQSNSPTSVLSIQLSSHAVIQADIEELTLIANAFGCSNEQYTLNIDAPTIEPDTQIIIDNDVPTTIGSCDTFTISAQSSTGSCSIK